MEEIKAGDIMLNNWFIGYDGKPFQWDAECFYLIQGVVSTNELINKPIPLTEDILLKAGANRIEENKVAIMLNDPSTHLVLMKVGTHWYPTIEQVDELGEIRIVFLNYIDYLHQGQNLFKSLTGNDLKINIGV